jgi:selenocysteine-specific elongation factor
MVEERGRLRATDLAALVGAEPRSVPGAHRMGRWWVADRTLDRAERRMVEALEAHHRDHPLRSGMEVSELVAGTDDDLGPEVLDRLHRAGRVVREGAVVRLATHQVTLGDREEEARRLVEAVAADEPTPPTVRELLERGFAADVVEGCLATGRLVRASPEVLLTPAFAGRVEEVARAESAAPDGLTVSRFRELVGTSRKYAVPILEWLDARGVTRRRGDVRRPGPAA